MSVINEKKTKRKLDLRLDLVPFTDYSIDTFVTSFETKDEGGTITKDTIDFPLNVRGSSICKGLKIRWHRKTGTNSHLKIPIG